MQPVEASRIKVFLKEHFQLPDEHLETMVSSISESLNLELMNAAMGLADHDKVALWKAAHSIKGALLNAGAEDWAEIAKTIELAARAGEDLDYAALLAELKDGVSGIL